MSKPPSSSSSRSRRAATPETIQSRGVHEASAHTTSTQQQRASNQTTTTTILDDDDDNDDPVIREMEVFLSPTLSHHLYLLQFPLQHNSVDNAKNARVKPKHGLVELDQALPTNIGSEGGFYLPHHTLASQTVPVTTHTALAKYQGDKVYLVPLQRIVQMRPSFRHVDEQDEMNKSTSESENTNTNNNNENDGTTNKKPLLFQKKESERAAMMRQTSYAFKKSSEDAEEWIHLSVHDAQSIEGQQAMLNVMTEDRETQLVPKSTHDDDKEMTKKKADSFVSSLNYTPNAVVEGSSNDNTTDKKDYNHQATLRKTCQELVLAMRRGFPIPYSVFKVQYPTLDHQDMLRCLSSCAVLVRGNFCLQSHLLGLPNARVVSIRNLILFLFQQRGHVRRSAILYALLEQEYNNDGIMDTSSAVYTFTSGWVTQLLEQVARQQNNGWVLKVTDDVSFLQQHQQSQYVQLHQQYWERQSVRLADYVRLYEEGLQREQREEEEEEYVVQDEDGGIQQEDQVYGEEEEEEETVGGAAGYQHPLKKEEATDNLEYQYGNDGGDEDEDLDEYQL